MIAIWTGRGFWTFGILIGVPGLVGAIVTVSGGEPILDAHPSILGCSLIAAAGLNWVVGRRLNGKPARILIDAQNGRKVRWRRRNTIFFLNMEYWSLPIALLGFVLTAREFVKL